METPSDAYFKNIIARRDPRYDGRFYFGVKTTGIYCRPVCPAKPKSENIVIFRSPSEAELAGYRACLRCRPDAGPGMKRLNESEQVVSRALRIIQHSAAETLTIQTLARTLGVTDRHIRRLFEQHLGASPIEFMITQRLHFARQMIEETAIPMTEIAFAAGFQSIRRFNESFKESYHTAPSSFRKQGAAKVSSVLAIRVPIRLPYHWASVIAYLQRHETYGVEDVSAGRYRRFIPLGKVTGVITVFHQTAKNYLSVHFEDIPLSRVRGLLACVKNLFDTEHNPLHLPVLKRSDIPGIRVPGHFDPFETAVSIILSQLVSTAHAKQTLKKLVCRFGRKTGLQNGREVFEFPSPRTLARANAAVIGIPRARARAIRELAEGVLKGTIDFTAPGGLAEMKGRLMNIHGIGPWTATMISMRCLNDADAFPEFDLIVQRVLKKKLVDPAAWVASRAYLTHSVWRDFGAIKEN